jgi:hypothetical protein
MATPPETVVRTASQVAVRDVSADPPSAARHVAIYDGQCEICQAFVSWLHLPHDRKDQVAALPIDAETLAVHDPNSTTVCGTARHLPSGQVYRGWNAVAMAQLFPPTFLIGWLGSLRPFRWMESLAIASSRAIAMPSASAVVAPAASRGGAGAPQTFFATFWAATSSGCSCACLIVGAGA